MNRLEKLKIKKANEFRSICCQGDQLLDPEYYSFQTGWDAASAEYENIIAELEKVLVVANGAMAYAYEDRADMFYLNVKEDIQVALQELKDFRG